ncbi:hypothetical protein C823_005795 [Eubacterium plexicaudatum ASF492]|nr:hypothetical protein C823_005795 [Eubacterium plexicaudatum ASF492]
MKKLKSRLLTLGLLGILALSSALAGCGQNQQDNNPQQDSSGVVGSTENNEQDTAVEIGSKDDFAKIYDDLSASYILTADIDFGGETVNPVGIFEPKSDAEEDAETPNTALAFTGTFDGNGHTLSNIKIDASDKNGVGLFGCMTGDGSWVKNLKVENISVKGGNYTGGVIGFADFGAYVEGITLSGENTVEGRFLIGGIAGASHADIVDCEAVADLTLTDANMQGAGIIVGGQEDGNLENCTAGGTITAPDGCYSIGGLAGCFHCSEYAKNCKAENIKIVTGDNCWLIGGLAGHSGTFENAPTLVENGIVKNVSIETGRNSERIGGITGGGFYSPMFKEYYPEPAKSDIKSCTVSEFTVSGGKYVGTAVGYSYGTTSVDGFDGQMTWDGSESKEQVGADESVKLEELK